MISLPSSNNMEKGLQMLKMRKTTEIKNEENAEDDEKK